jgi:hypothetical protein
MSRVRIRGLKKRAGLLGKGRQEQTFVPRLAIPPEFLFLDIGARVVARPAVLGNKP